MVAIEVHNLRKAFTRRGLRPSRGTSTTALDDVTFDVGRGECVSILGRNGSGKSTLVRILATLIIPDGGRAAVFGHDVVADAASVRRLVNRVSVEASFFKRMSATENLSYAARFYGLLPRDTRAGIPRILDRVGFPAGRRDVPMQHLSRGTQQKVALARALLTSPVLLLLDEPTTGLDPRSRREVQELVRSLRESHDTSILLCTHDTVEAEALSDRVGILDRGRLADLGSPTELLDRYGAATLEDVFFTATGHTFDEADERDRVAAR